MTQLSKTQIQEYRQNGYLLFPEYFDNQAMDRFRSAAEALSETAGPVVPDNPRIAVNQTNTGARIRMVWPLVDISSTFSELASDPRIIGPVRTLFDGDAPILFEDKLNYKYPGGSRGWFMHQDYSYWQEYCGPFLISVLIYLDDATDDNGPLEIVSGRHREGLFPFSYEDDGKNGQHIISEQSLDPAAAVKVTGKAGTTLVFSTMTPHRSSPNDSDSFRRALIFTYTPGSEGEFYEIQSGEQRDLAEKWKREQQAG